MANSYFQFRQFSIQQDKCAMKVTTDACLFGAWVARKIMHEKNEAERVLDIGTGTGLLSLMLAQQNSKTDIDAIEIDGDASTQAGENFAGSPWHKHLRVIHCDARAFVFTKNYTSIISNPPFYEKEWISPDAKKNTAHHSSQLFFEELLQVVRKGLAPAGRFYLLLPFKREKELKLLLALHGLYIEEEIRVRPTVNHDFSRLMIAGTSQAAAPPVISSLSIRDGHGRYSAEFSGLLENYYLNL